MLCSNTKDDVTVSDCHHTLTRAQYSGYSLFPTFAAAAPGVHLCHVFWRHESALKMSDHFCRHVSWSDSTKAQLFTQRLTLCLSPPMKAYWIPNIDVRLVFAVNRCSKALSYQVTIYTIYSHYSTRCALHRKWSTSASRWTGVVQLS